MVLLLSNHFEHRVKYNIFNAQNSGRGIEISA